MIIAIPVENGRLTAHFGSSRYFALVDVDPNTRTVLRSDILPAPEHQPGLFPRWLREQGTAVVIAGGIGQRALTIFAQHGIHVVAGQPNAPAETLVAGYLAGQLIETPEGCAHHHGHHNHDHGHVHPDVLKPNAGTPGKASQGAN